MCVVVCVVCVWWCVGSHGERMGRYPNEMKLKKMKLEEEKEKEKERVRQGKARQIVFYIQYCIL